MIFVRDEKGRTHAAATRYERRILHHDSAVFARLYVLRAPLFGDTPEQPSLAIAKAMLEVSRELVERSME